MKRIFTRTAAAFLAAVLLYPIAASGISAQKAIVMDAETGRVIYEKRADERSLIASTTKIMTALIVCEQCNVLDRMMIPKEAVGIEGSSMYLEEGEILTIQELLYGLMLSSGNDAAVALAIYCGGTVEGFVQLMNDKARMLELEGTHFMNPHGLDAPDHYSTARDLAILSCYAMENPIFARTVGTKTVRVGQRTLRNHNKLLWRLDGAEGIKTGYTKAAGRILVSSVQRSGRRIVMVTINDGDDWQDHKTLCEQGYGQFKQVTLVEPGDALGRIQVLCGTKDSVSVAASQGFSYPVAEGERVQIFLSSKGFDYAPVAANGDAGFAYICLNGNVIGKIPVHYAETIELQS